MDRKLASIQKITDIQPIPNADKIEVATVLSWRVVIKKGEFKVGDLCCFFEIDSMLPRQPWNDFLADKNHPDKPIRLRTVKLRQQISQGLVIPLSVAGVNGNEGDDVTEILKIEKYEAPIPVQLAGLVRGVFPSHVPKTDQIRIQSEPELIEEVRGLECYWSVKVDGTSASFINIDGDHHVCSRNLSLKETEGNLYWQMYHKYNLKEILNSVGNFAIQGECVGSGIQNNRMGLKEHELMVFDVYDIKGGKYLNYSEFFKFCNDHGLKTVPLLKIDTFCYKSVDELVEVALSCKYPNGSIGEGYVIRPTIEKYSEILSGRLSFKIINNDYLLKNGE